MAQNSSELPKIRGHFASRVDRLPVPEWVGYSILLASSTLLSYITLAVAGQFPSGAWPAIAVYDVLASPMIITTTLAFQAHLDRAIAEAVMRSRPFSSQSEKAFARMRDEMIQLPAWPARFVTLLAVAAALARLMPYFGFEQFDLRTLAVWINWGPASGIFMVFIYRMARLVVLTRRFYAGPITVSLYRLNHVYDLSAVAAKGGLFTLVVWYVNVPFNVDEQLLSSPLFLGVTTFIALLPVAAFLLPLGTLNRQLAREKAEAIAHVHHQLESAYKKVTLQFEADRFGEMADLGAAISNLTAKRDFISSIPTWPWQEGAFRLTLTAVLLPIVVWLVQQILDRVLGI